MEDDEHIEALAWCDYWPQENERELHGGAIVATDRRVLFVSNGWLDTNVSVMHYEWIDDVALKEDELVITPKPGYSGCKVASIDDMSPHDSRRKGHGKVFAGRLKILVGNAYQAAAPSSTENPSG